MFNPAMFDSMKHMMNPAMMKQSAEMMSKMSDEELKQCMGMAGMNADPAMLRAASSNMAKMDDSTLENMKNTAASRFPATPTSAPVHTPSTSTDFNDEISVPLGLKNQGNDFFKQGRTSDAAVKYRMGISEIEKLPMSKAASDLEVTLRMNLAACLVKEQDYDEVILQCKKALLLGENPKAFYRYGQALFHLGSYEKSLEYLEKAKNLSPADINSNI
jgi:tetratricopeptide (TPR) repeat protein